MLPNYSIDEFGVIHQIESTPITYDKAYISYYEDKSDRTIKLGYQRLGWILGMLGRIPEAVLEIGYGTGTFIEAARIAGTARCAGCDIAMFPLPDGVNFLPWDEALCHPWTLTAMFDVLEHIPDLGFLDRLETEYLAISVPYCRWRELGDSGDAWFQGWRMWLPNEHLHHFDREALVSLLGHHGYECLTLNTFEDGLRLRPGEVGPNVLSGFFRRTPSSGVPVSDTTAPA